MHLPRKKASERARDREGGGERETDRERDRETDRQTGGGKETTKQKVCVYKSNLCCERERGLQVCICVLCQRGLCIDTRLVCENQRPTALKVSKMCARTDLGDDNPLLLLEGTRTTGARTHRLTHTHLLLWGETGPCRRVQHLVKRPATCQACISRTRQHMCMSTETRTLDDISTLPYSTSNDKICSSPRCQPRLHSLPPSH